MDRSFVELLAAPYRRLHDQVLILIDDLNNQQLSWRATPTSRSIAHTIAQLTRSSHELQPGSSGAHPTTGDVPGHHVEKDALLDDARQAFAAVEQLLAASLSAAQGAPAIASGTSDALISHLARAYQYLGEIESLCGLQEQARPTPGPTRDDVDPQGQTSA